MKIPFDNIGHVFDTEDCRVNDSERSIIHGCLLALEKYVVLNKLVLENDIVSMLFSS